MKIKILLFALLSSMSLSAGAQALKTVKEYYDPWTCVRIKEVYTVIAATGMMHGNYKQYYPNGLLFEDSYYTRGELNGPYKVYHDVANVLKESGTYKNNERHGTWTEYGLNPNTKKNWVAFVFQYDNGDKISETEYHSNGKKAAVKAATGYNASWDEEGNLRWGGNMVKYKWEGQYIWNHNGEKYEKYYTNGVETGTHTTYNSKGEVLEKIIYGAPGEVQRKITFYLSPDRKKRETNYNPDGCTQLDYDSISQSITVKRETNNGNPNWRKITTFYSNGGIKSVLENKQTSYYDENGTIKEMVEADGTSLMYKNGVLHSKLMPFKEGGESKVKYVVYNTSEQITESGVLNGQGKNLSFIKFDNGVKLMSRDNTTGEFCIFYPSGALKRYRQSKDALIGFEFEEDGHLRSKWHSQTNKTVYYYPSGKVKSKGEEKKTGERVGLWYLYDEKGKLSVEENGIIRKPTNTEKQQAETYLQDIASTPVPTIPGFGNNPIVKENRQQNTEILTRFLGK